MQEAGPAARELGHGADPDWAFPPKSAGGRVTSVRPAPRDSPPWRLRRQPYGLQAGLAPAVS
ncbi:hypothetical protein Acor_82920 [Acrocarpospora corrugata]|uniref:Uncharacterized protein n=1 Tax=Acrocarpospora corrugata TaxID=35763 RepID=A0A5M3WGC9_9ACTN|nr:hypothetical protein Acor_82920 [Acrocarpospora corrugata]